MVLSRVFALDITALLATSGILAATIGLALQPSLSNVLSGIFVSLERPFRRNEWISVEETLGLVLDTNWRATTLRTLSNVVVTVPNEIISKSMISNWSRPDEELMSKGFHVNHSLHFHPRHDPSQITAVISNTLKVIKPVDGRSKLDRQFVKFIDNDEFGLKFAIGYDCTDRTMEYSQRHAVLTELHKSLGHAGISMSSGKLFTSLTEDAGLSAVPHTFRKVDDFDPNLRGSMNPYNESVKNTSLMRTVPLFSTVSADALEKIARGCSRVIFGPAESIFQQDDTESSLFIIVDGVVSIEKTLLNNAVIKVGNLGVGEFFGEMALLTGEPRTASAISLTDTKLLKIEANALKDLLDGDEEFLEKISNIYAHRLLMTEKLESVDLEISKELPSAIQQFKTKLLAFLA